ncbi:ABC transporter permease [Aestuariirhabdus litorea]|uniref:ABC transporter permease n=1 Tax=Aestuariirhabdus litorea TaxID=2528527 RepID=A0A3P3VT89_9GAMM|nr:ABC transporter permease [Aestuariirhabdus litorea]RRJ84689.1 ABC transporter permease [Aestuariirhabdus litorea]RWW97914.1 ABC transporter permease subunit [Endozoicomonadaceae bacterium GTF-13]
MIPSIPSSRLFQLTYRFYVVAFFIYLLLPLTIVILFSFNDSLFPSLPWKGFTLDWYLGTREPRLGIFHDSELLESVWTSVVVAAATTVLSVVVSLCNAFLFEREEFAGKNLLYLMMLVPLVIPGVILGVSILIFGSSLANHIEAWWGFDIEGLRPGLPLVVLGQFAFITTICTLVISARLRKFDQSLEEAALNLGASRWTAIRTITLPYLRPALVGAAIVSFLMSFENFNTTLMLVGSDAPLTIAMFDRLREGSTPVINAVSTLLMLFSGALAMASVFVQRPARG